MVIKNNKVLQSILYVVGYFLIVLSALSCGERKYYEGFESFPDKNWYYDSLSTFQFDIDETSKPYNVYFVLRNSLDYEFYNIYVKYYLKNQEGKIERTGLSEFILMDSKTGKPFGDDGTPFGSGGAYLYDHKFMLLENYQFEKTGAYQLEFKQYMRLDTLAEVLGVGANLEKVE